MKARLKEQSSVPPPRFTPDSLFAVHFSGLALESRFGAIDEELSAFQLCNSCELCLSRDSDKPPRCALANFLSRGIAPPELTDLTWAERRLIALFRPSLFILTLQGKRTIKLPDGLETHPSSSSKELDTCQWKLRGHCFGNY